MSNYSHERAVLRGAIVDAVTIGEWHANRPNPIDAAIDTLIKAVIRSNLISPAEREAALHANSTERSGMVLAEAMDDETKMLLEGDNALRFVRSGKALADLQAQLTRLMSSPCPTMAFGFGPDDTAKAVTSEIAEILAEKVGSQAAKRECAGLLAASVRMAMIHGADPVECIQQEANRLKSRLDTMHALGCTWEAAKAIEHDPRNSSLWSAIAFCSKQGGRHVAAWYVDGDDPHVVLVSLGELGGHVNNIVKIAFDKWQVRDVVVHSPRDWWWAVLDAEKRGFRVASTNPAETGVRLSKPERAP